MFFSKRLIPKKEERAIVQAIAEAELLTSGEIRVHIEKVCEDENPLSRAVAIFNAIGMYETAQRNGVLIYIALKSRKFAIIGDIGINKVIPDNFWNEVRNSLGKYLANGEVEKGIVEAIAQTGKILQSKFPYLEGDINEQSDEISYGK